MVSLAFSKRVGNDRNHLIDYIRAVCMCMVIITHVSWSDIERRTALFPLVIDTAVPLFLIISSYLRAKKYKRNGINEAFSRKNIFREMTNLMVAYSITAFIEVIAAIVFDWFRLSPQHEYIQSFSALIRWFLTGLSGPGSYYVPIMIQLIFLLPLLYKCFTKSATRGLVICALINLVYELLVYISGLNPDVYRLLIFRYILIIGFGIYLAKIEQNKKADVGAIICLIYGIIFEIVNLRNPVVLFQSWKSTSMLCAPYAYGIMYLLMRIKHPLKETFFSTVGQISYEMFLTQMVFFSFGGGSAVYRIFKFIPSPLNHILEAVVAIVLCFIVGYVFHAVIERIKRRFQKIE